MWCQESLERVLVEWYFLHAEAAAIFRIAHGVELDEEDAAFARAWRARPEEVP